MEIRLFNGCLLFYRIHSRLHWFSLFFGGRGSLCAPPSPAWHWLFHTWATNSWRDGFYWISCKFHVIISLSPSLCRSATLTVWSRISTTRSVQHAQLILFTFCCRSRVMMMIIFELPGYSLCFADQWRELKEQKGQFNWRMVENAVSGPYLYSNNRPCGFTVLTTLNSTVLILYKAN